MYIFPIIYKFIQRFYSLDKCSFVIIYYSTVTLFARLRGLSTSNPLASVFFYIFGHFRSCSYKTHITSLCQLRNNFFSKISHKAQYYQLTLKISTKKEPLISQKSQILRFYVYSISPNCTILA